MTARPRISLAALARVSGTDLDVVRGMDHADRLALLNAVAVTDNDQAIARHCGLRPVEVALMTEDQRLAAVRGAGSVPDACQVGPSGLWPGIGPAPARVGKGLFQPVATYPKGVDDVEVKPAGFMGRAGLADRDIWDDMAAQAKRARRAFAFTNAQVTMARDYRALVEAVEASGAPRSCLADRTGGADADPMQAAIDTSRRLDAVRARIGTGTAMDLRRVRPSDRRKPITDRALIDGLCLAQLSIDAVLIRHGWTPKGSVRACARVALIDILERMMGPVAGSRRAHFTRTDVGSRFWADRKGD